MKLAFLLIAVPCAALAQVQPRSDTGPAQPPTDIARSMCEALAGPERDRCLAEQSLAPDQGRPLDSPGRGDTRRSCDDLLGPDKEACLKKGGHIKAGAGATRLTR